MSKRMRSDLFRREPRGSRADDASPPNGAAAAPPVEAPSPGAGSGAGLGELMVERGIINPTQLAAARSQQPASGKRLGVLLVELGAVSERTLVEVLSEHLGIAWVDLRHHEPEPEILALVPEALARACSAIPLRRVDGQLEVAAAEPTDPEIARQIREAVDVAVSLLLAPASDIARAIERSYRALAGMDRHIEAFTASAALRETAGPQPTTTPADAPVVRAVDLLITQALRDRASDIHIEPQEGRLRIRYRVDGVLKDELALPDTMSAAVVSRIKIMADMNIVDRRRPQDGQIAKEVDGRWIDIRVSTTPTIWGEKAVLRLLDRTQTIFQLDDLGMTPSTHEQYSRLVRSPIGMVICAGPTGSGKTTTLYSTLNEINDVEHNVTTVEDPVEYVFPSINQIQINEEAGITFAGGLRSILRQDPDIILVGEIRDAETAQIAVQSALTGHLVLSSLHATDAAAALHRFLDMGIESFLVASSVIAVVSQRLVRRICNHCRAPHTPSLDEMAFYEASGGPPKSDFTRGEGCNFCSGTGYLGRIGVYELLPVNDAVKQVLVDKGSLDELRAAGAKGGVRTLPEEGMRVVGEDVTTIAEIARSVYTMAG